MAVGSGHLHRTLQSLESGLRVGDIATFSLVSCRAVDSARSVLADPQWLMFDQFPVKDDGSVVGVLERPPQARNAPDQPARKLMKPIGGAMLVESELPLPRFIAIAARSPYYLIVRDARISGLVTRSDLLKMPVRLMAFAFVAHLESRMAEFVTRRHPSNEWVDLLPERQRKDLFGAAKKLADDRLDPDLIELTVLSQKATVVAKTLALSAAEIEELTNIRRLRNDIAHGKPFAETDAELADFIATLRSTERWIAQLRGYTAGAADWAETPRDT